MNRSMAPALIAVLLLGRAFSTVNPLPRVMAAALPGVSLIAPAASASPPASLRAMLPADTPAPQDLELSDIVVDLAGYPSTLMGRIRNNTKQPVYFRGADFGLEFSIAEWSLTDSLRYRRLLRSPIRPTGYHNGFTSCYLRPGETGIIGVSLSCEAKEGCSGSDETFLSPPATLGTVLQYSSRPQPFPGDDPPPKETLTAEHIQFVRREDILFVRFFVTVPAARMDESIDFLLVWLDKDGTILNVAADDQYIPEDGPARVEIRGWMGSSRMGWGVAGYSSKTLLPVDRKMLDALSTLEVILQPSTHHC